MVGKLRAAPCGSERLAFAGDAPVDLDREVELMMASEFGYLMSDTDRFLDYEGQEDDWRDTPEY